MPAKHSQDSLAPYAVRSADCRGRTHAEQPDPLRTPFELDRHRVISCTAFRRVRSKTQVFGGSQRRDHYRTRLTHSLEVAGISRLMARKLRANETLAETIALAHDLGHPPFGHAGEAALEEMMADHGGFEHNAHALRVVDFLEHPFPAFRGLNLTYEVREGLIKHITQFDTPRQDDPDPSVADLLESGPIPTVEAQIVALADRLAYDLHDLEDAIGAGFVDHDALESIALWHESRSGIEAPPGTNIHAIRRPVLDAMLNTLLADAIQTSTARLATCKSPDDTRQAGGPSVVLSEQMNNRLKEAESLLGRRVYDRPEVAGTDAQARQIVRMLFTAYCSRLDELPQRFRSRIDDQGVHRVVCDYIAGMTDRYCRTEHARIVQR